jgi:formylglycine-generating enzyme required for sulfatase activity
MTDRTPPAEADFATLLRWHLDHGTRPNRPYNPDFRWTHSAFATAVGVGSRESVAQWVAKAKPKLPAFLNPILSALFSDDPAHASARRQLLMAFDVAKAARDARIRRRGQKTTDPADLDESLSVALPILQAARAPAGATWVTRDNAVLDIDTSPASTDIEAASRPDVADRHEGVKRKIATLGRTLGQRLDNFRGWEDFGPAVDELRRTTDCSTADLPGRMVRLYDAIVSVASYIDQDNSIANDASSLFEPLPPDIRRSLTDLIASAAPFVRAFPSARATDDEAGSFLTRRELFHPAQTLLNLAEARNLIAPEAASLARAELGVASKEGFQAQKAGNRAVGSLRNLIAHAAWVIGTVYLGALGSQIQAGGSVVARKAGEVFIAGEAAIVTLIEDMPPHIRGAVDAAMQANKEGRAQDIDDHGDSTLSQDQTRSQRWRPTTTALARWREPIPGLPEEAWPDMVTIPPGRFVQGAPKTELQSRDDERPQREVNVRLFAMGRCAVTFAQWDAANAARAGLRVPDDEGWGRGDRPVINVSWKDAQAYCAWLNGRLGSPGDGLGPYRLPTESEWEYACRAGTETPFSFGETITTEQANYNGNGTYGRVGRKGVYRRRTVPVGSFPGNAWGLHEMHGNVWEWVLDVYWASYKGAPIDGRPVGGLASAPRVLRGGSWDYYPRDLRSAARVMNDPDNRYYSVGFRLARTLSPPGP